MSEAVVVETDGHVVTIRLNRPDERNSMTPDLLEGVSGAAREIRDRPDVRCVIVTGSGKTFCGGADFRGGTRTEEALSPHEQTYQIYEHFLSLLELEVPTIAAMNGHAIGGGLGLALVCDLRVANDKARYGANFVRLGMHPGMASTLLLPRFMGVPRALELLMTGRIISGEEAERYGLVHYAVGAEEVLGKARELANEIATAAPQAVRWTKRSVYDAMTADPAAVAYREAMLQSRSMETNDFREGVRALLEKREPAFQGG